MGAIQSIFSSGNSINTTNTQAALQTSGTTLVLDNLETSDGIENFQLQYSSVEDMEADMKKIYERSTEMIRNLTYNPCDHFTRCIVGCLEHNAQRMSDCFVEMNKYQECVLREQQLKQRSKTSTGSIQQINTIQ